MACNRYIVKHLYILAALMLISNNGAMAIPSQNQGPLDPPAALTTVVMKNQPLGNEKKSEVTDDNDNVEVVIKESNLPAYIGEIKGWHLLTMKIANQKICYTIKYPFQKVGNHTNNRTSYVMVAYISPKKQEVSAYMGYLYRLNSNVNVSIDNNQTIMKADKTIAWSRHQFDDFIMIDQMLSGVSLKIKAESVYGSYSIDLYNLEGFAETYQKMLELCQPVKKKR